MCIHMFLFFQGQVNLLKVHVLYTGTVYRAVKHHFFYSKPKYTTRKFYLLCYSMTNNLKIGGPLCFDKFAFLNFSDKDLDG